MRDLGNPSPTKRKKSEGEAITLDSGEQIPLSPLALAMGIDPRRNEASLNKLKKVMKKPEEEGAPEEPKSAPKEVEKPVVRSGARRRGDTKPLEVNATTARIPGLPANAQLPPPRKLNIPTQKRIIVPEKPPQMEKVVLRKVRQILSKLINL
jgi:hypothetical protein